MNPISCALVSGGLLFRILSVFFVFFCIDLYTLGHGLLACSAAGRLTKNGFIQSNFLQFLRRTPLW
jgi:hypothetical protein